MNNARVLLSQNSNPWFNLATEEWIFNDMDKEEQILFLWQNEPCVIIGRNQNPWVECNINLMNKEKINLVRRQSGGGAVFQDQGNINFTFLSDKSNYDRTRNFQIIINSLKRLGINAEQKGRNDILVEDKKVSGSAFKETSKKAFHHGTLMINVDLNRLQNYLTPSQNKLDAKGIKSVRARVANLNDFLPNITKEQVLKSIIDEFFKTYGQKENITKLDYSELQKIPSLDSYYNLLKSDEWRLGETPNFSHNLKDSFVWGSLNLNLHVEKGKIVKTKIFSDSLNTNLIEKLTECLINSNYELNSIKRRLDDLKSINPELNEYLMDVQNFLEKHIT